jgi:hypothetical protein
MVWDRLLRVSATIADISQPIAFLNRIFVKASRLRRPVRHPACDLPDLLAIIPEIVHPIR